MKKFLIWCLIMAIIMFVGASLYCTFTFTNFVWSDLIIGWLAYVFYLFPFFNEFKLKKDKKEEEATKTLL